MAESKTKPTEVSVDSFLDSVASEERRADARVLIELMRGVSGEPPCMWGPSIIGFGRYHYRYESGREGEMCRIGFSPRKAEQVLYLSLSDDAQQALLPRLGKHRTGKGCLYIRRLADVDLDVLEALVRTALDRMNERYPD